jgi:hypothetical protein
MTTINGTILIKRPVEDVFDFVADERNEPAYNPQIGSVEKVTPGPIGVGTVWRAVAASRPRATPFELEVTEYARPHRLTSLTRMRGIDISGGLTFAPDGESTRMDWSWDLRPKGMAKLAGPLIAALGRKREQQIWSGLKTQLESTV